MTTPLGFDDLKGILHQWLDHLPDHRKQGPNTSLQHPGRRLGCLWHLFHPIAVVSGVPTPSPTNQGPK